MQEIGGTERVITILGTDADWTRQLASKLLIGKGMWEVSWFDCEVRVRLNTEFTNELIHALIKPFSEVGLIETGDKMFKAEYPLWDVWKEDFRFMKHLQSLTLLHDVFAELKKEIESSDTLSISDILSKECFTDELNYSRTILTYEGLVAPLLQEQGWL